MNLIIMRHGQSITNSRQYAKDDGQNILTKNGIDGVIDSARRFRSANPEYHFDVSFASPIARAVQTHFNFLSVMGNKAIDTNFMDGFKERRLAEEFVELEDFKKDIGIDMLDRWEYDMDIVPTSSWGKGESLNEVYDRVTETFQEFVVPELRSGKRILITSHYYVCKALIAHLVYKDRQYMTHVEAKNAHPFPIKYK